MKFMKYLLIMSLFVFVPALVQAEDVSVVTDEWQGYTEKDGTGLYLDIINAAFPSPEYNVIIKHVP